MEPTDITVAVLREIRDEIRETRTELGGLIAQTNARIDQTNERLGQTNERLDQTRSDLLQRLTESETRTATAIVGLSGTLDQVKTQLTERTELRDRLERCETDIQEIKLKIGA